MAFINSIVSSFTNNNGSNFEITGTVFAVPWETDSLPIIGSLLLLGGAWTIKRKLSKTSDH